MDISGVKKSQNAECLLKRNCIKLMLGFNIPFKNPLDDLHGREGF